MAFISYMGTLLLLSATALMTIMAIMLRLLYDIPSFVQTVPAPGHGTP